MKEYYFKETKDIDDYIFVFLCGISYKSAQSDKRNVLHSFLKEQNPNYRPIILEKYFATGSSVKMLTYREAGFKNLYQVEMLVSILSDYNFIILESISTGAEAGMFLGRPESQGKTCLLVPDDMAVEEDKLGAFLKYSFDNSNVKIVRFYPQVLLNKSSVNVSNWYTFFLNNKIGNNLKVSIQSFLTNNTRSRSIIFTKNLSCAKKNGWIHYDFVGDMLNIDIDPRTLLICVISMMNCNDFEQQFFLKENTIQTIEAITIEWLEKLFINSIAEKEGIKAATCKISVLVNIKDFGIQWGIGMIIYLLHAAELIEISKCPDYEDTGCVVISRKMVDTASGKSEFSFLRYREVVSEVIERKINV